MDEEIIRKVSERRLKDEIQSGIQTIQYQLITLMTCNGQAPFVTIFMYLDEYGRDCPYWAEGELWKDVPVMTWL